ncbi:MAG: DUF4118 domain-containing protein [Alphaproteobacteria bacterium]|nr:DUF4118 domain-containing protein [Alphaproteobacteria bacterium]
MVSTGTVETQLHHFITDGETGSRGRNFFVSVSITVATVIFTSLVAWLLVLAGFPSPETLSVLFVIPVLVGAVLYGLLVSLIAAVFSVLAYNFVLLPPVWHIGLWEVENIAKMFALSFVAIVASTLSSRIHKLAQEAMQRERVLSGVYALSQDMLGIANIPDMRRAAEAKLSSLLDSEATIILRSEKERFNQAGQFCIDNNTPVGSGTKHFTDNPNLYLPLSVHESALGLLCVGSDVSGRFSSKVLATLTAQTASAIEKARLAEAHEKNCVMPCKRNFIPLCFLLYRTISKHRW